MELREEEGVTVAAVVAAFAEAGGPWTGCLRMDLEGRRAGRGVVLIGRAYRDACCWWRLHRRRISGLCFGRIHRGGWDGRGGEDEGKVWI